MSESAPTIDKFEWQLVEFPDEKVLKVRRIVDVDKQQGEPVLYVWSSDQPEAPIYIGVAPDEHGWATKFPLDGFIKEFIETGQVTP